MSRLTKRDEHGVVICNCINCDSMCDFCHFSTQQNEKLATYEDIGEPEELAKVVQCKDCGYRDTWKCPMSILHVGGDGNNKYVTNIGIDFYCAMCYGMESGDICEGIKMSEQIILTETEKAAITLCIHMAAEEGLYMFCDSWNRWNFDDDAYDVLVSLLKKIFDEEEFI